MMMRKNLWIAVFAVMSSLAFHSTAWAADGEAGYKKHCQSCHGAGGKASGPMASAMGIKDLDIPKWAGDDALPIIEKAIRDGVPKMPAMKGKMSDAEITAVAKYVQSLAKAAK
jgi:mono/diheme cytochrome c family protein